MNSISLEAKCAKCDAAVAITKIETSNIEYLTKPAGLSLDDLCQLGKDRGQECPHLKRAIDERIAEFRNEQG